MIRSWQAVAAILAVSAATPLSAQERKGFPWNPPKITTSLFTNDLGMLDREREEYASNLANLATNTLRAKSTTGLPPQASLDEARRMLALALQISPRNRRAVVINYQLTKGILPDPAPCEYSRESFARLLLTRGQLLDKQGGSQNQLLAHTFIELAAELDPKNEDAIYASEMKRLDLGRVDWKLITDPADTRPSDPPANPGPATVPAIPSTPATPATPHPVPATPQPRRILPGPPL